MKITKAKNQVDLTDKEVWELFRSGSNSAFEFIYKEYFDKLYNYGCQFTQDHSLVEDTIQELFLELNRRKEYLSATDKILPYLYGAFRRKIVRNRNNQNRFEKLDVGDTFPLEVSIEAMKIMEEEADSKKEKLANAITKLQEKDREMIFLFYYENLSYDEIREIHNFENIKSARNRLYKALIALRRHMLFGLLITVGLFYP